MRFTTTPKDIRTWQAVFVPPHKDRRRVDDRGWWYFTVGVFKFNNKLVEGIDITGQNYSGFIWRFAFWTPFEIL